MDEPRRALGLDVAAATLALDINLGALHAAGELTGGEPKSDDRDDHRGDDRTDAPLNERINGSEVFEGERGRHGVRR
jgi:hypothetical protein